MPGTTFLLIVATVLTLEGDVATIDRGHLTGLQPGDEGVFYYELTVGQATRRVKVGTGTVRQVGERKSQIKVAGGADIKPEYEFEIQIPIPEAAGEELLRQTRGGHEKVSSRSLGEASEDWTSDEEGDGPKDAQGMAVEERVAEEVAAEEMVAEGSVAAPTARGMRGAEEAFAQDPVAAPAAREVTVAEPIASEPIVDESIVDEPIASESIVDEPVSDEPPSADAEVREIVLAWAQAWSDQRVDDYLSLYASNFRVPNGMSREAWEAQRRQRITRPSSIDVSLEQLEIVTVASKAAAATFVQSYRSDTYQDRVSKLLDFVREDGQWKIREERLRE